MEKEMALYYNSANTILYCLHWQQTVAFYRDKLGLGINFSNDWFVEFLLNDRARLSIADQSRASVKTSSGHGITLALETRDIESAWTQLNKKGILLTQIRDHSWGARVFYFFDPEGHRIEIWQSRQ
jgi:catechol 2,3-dioxygenase-like lactoylglutathione lyase family enzyme